MNGQIESNTAIEAGLSATSADVLNARRGKRSAGLRSELLLIPSGARNSSGPSHKLSKPASTSLLVASGVNDERIREEPAVGERFQGRQGELEAYLQHLTECGSCARATRAAHAPGCGVFSTIFRLCST